jgi:hypothetical protein
LADEWIRSRLTHLETTAQKYGGEFWAVALVVVPRSMLAASNEAFWEFSFVRELSVKVSGLFCR